MTAYMVKMDVMWVQVFFFGGLLLGLVAQVIAYVSGERNRRRLVGMCFGIAAIVLMAAAARIASVKARDYANSISARLGG